jgi:hypothetical protein
MKKLLLDLLLVALLSACANVEPMTAHDMAVTLYQSRHPAVHRLGASWLE